jgi:peptidyl-prolyl cis-trans isomerase SurA
MKLQIADLRLKIGGVLTLAVLVGIWVSAVRAEVIDRMLAVVAGDVVLQSDVRAAREFGLVSFDSSAADADREVLARLIDRALVLAEVDRFAPPEPDAASVDMQVAAVRARFPTDQAYSATLARVGIEERHLRERVRQDLRMAAYLDQRFTTAPPSEDELTGYYRERAASFTRGGVLVPFETVRQEIVQAVIAETRRVVVDEWLAGLRRRADIRIVDP